MGVAMFIDFFINPKNVLHKQYEALRSFYVDGRLADDVAKQYGYTKSAFYSLVRDFKIRMQSKDFNLAEHFFKTPVAGRRVRSDTMATKDLIIELRKKHYSVPDIKTFLDADGRQISERHIYTILMGEGFVRLPRRDKTEKASLAINPKTLAAPKAQILKITKPEKFTSNACGVLIFLPYIVTLGLDKLISASLYPETTQLSRINSILSFVTLKLTNVCRYSTDDLWCMDRGLGLFAGLNVLPKASWYTSYSNRITREMNLSFLRGMSTIWQEHGLLSDSINMDFVTVPYWGEESHLENNWSGTRHHALSSMLAALAHDPDSGIITYGDSTIRHEDESATAVEFLDFYKKSGNANIKYLIFDSKFTTYQNLKKLDDSEVCFITIRRRGKKIIEELAALDKKQWKKVKVPMAHGRTRHLTIHEQLVFINSYGKELRQIAITGHGKIKPALIITNDFETAVADIIRKYARRWLVEKTIAEQTHFFHLNRLSSSMVIKVDFDLTMTILAHNLYRLLAQDLPGFTNCTAQSLYNKFINNSGYVEIEENNIVVKLKKKRNLPMILEAMQQYSANVPWIKKSKISFHGASMS